MEALVFYLKSAECGSNDLIDRQLDRSIRHKLNLEGNGTFDTLRVLCSPFTEEANYVSTTIRADFPTLPVGRSATRDRVGEINRGGRLCGELGDR